MAIFWDVAPCRLTGTVWCFRGASCLHKHGYKTLEKILYQKYKVHMFPWFKDWQTYRRKRTVIIYFDCDGIIYHELIPPINEQYYTEVLCLQETVQYPEKKQNGNWHLTITMHLPTMPCLLNDMAKNKMDADTYSSYSYTVYHPQHFHYFLNLTYNKFPNSEFIKWGNGKQKPCSEYWELVSYFMTLHQQLRMSHKWDIKNNCKQLIRWHIKALSWLFLIRWHIKALSWLFLRDGENHIKTCHNGKRAALYLQSPERVCAVHISVEELCCFWCIIKHMLSRETLCLTNVTNLVILWWARVERPAKEQFCHYTTQWPHVNSFTKGETCNTSHHCFRCFAGLTVKLLFIVHTREKSHFNNTCTLNVGQPYRKITTTYSKQILPSYSKVWNSEPMTITWHTLRTYLYLKGRQRSINNSTYTILDHCPSPRW
jgi:hypothetical protein